VNAVAPIVANGSRVRIPVALLQVGMFVSDLDRPWADSPFLIEGLLIEREAEIALVQSICREVTIDLGRSASVDFPGIERPELDELELARQAKEAEADRLARQGALMMQQAAAPNTVATRPVEMPGVLASLARWAFGRGVSDANATHARADDPQPHQSPRPRPASSAADIAPDLAERPLGLLERVRRVFHELVAPGSKRDRRERSATALPFESAANPGSVASDAKPKGKGETAPVHLGLSVAEAAAAEDEIRSFELELPIAREKLADADVLMNRVAELIRSGGLLKMEQVSPVASAIVESITRNQNAMLWLSRLRAFDERAHARSVQCGVYMATFGRHLGLSQEVCEHLTIGGMVLDVGKLRVPPGVLAKPGPLVGEEVSLVRDHVMLGVAMLENSMGMHPSIVETVLRHHEREDGSGYPSRLRERDIGLYGRIAGIVDTFLALTNPRPYAAEVTMQEALRVLLAGRGTLFHAPLVEHFIQSISLFPVGSLVELSNGEIAAVVAHNRVRRLKPRVMVMIERDGSRRERPTILDLLYSPQDEQGQEIRILRGVSPEALGIDASELFLSAGLS
jgi:HD-GYP domain-containing protein (c-di-GMP phosphodiesterase class II)